MEYSVDEMDTRERARIVKTAVSPRPIAWISTVSEDDDENLAPFSSYNYVESRQPIVLFNTANESAGGLKDTARNALDTGEFAVNVVTESHLEQMDHTAESVPSEESEFDLAGVDRAGCQEITPPRVTDAAVTLECTLYDSLEIRDRLMVIGEVQYFHVADEVMTDGQIDSRRLRTIGRLGGPYYTVAEPIEFERRY